MLFFIRKHVLMRIKNILGTEIILFPVSSHIHELLPLDSRPVIVDEIRGEAIKAETKFWVPTS